MRCCVPVLRLLVVLTLPLALNLAAADSGLAAERGRTAASDDAARLEKRIDDLESQLRQLKDIETLRRQESERKRGDDLQRLGDRFQDVKTQTTEQAKAVHGLDVKVTEALSSAKTAQVFLAGLGLLITLCMVIIGGISFFNAGRKGREEAEKAAEQWLKENMEKYEDNMLAWGSRQESEFKSKIEKLVEEYKNKFEQELQCLCKVRNDAEENLAQIISKVQLAASEGRSPALSDKQEKLLEEAGEELKSEDESGFAYTDWRLKAFIAYNNSDYMNAVRCFEKIIEDAGAPDNEKAKALFNKGIALHKQNNTDGELATYDDVIRRFGDSRDPGVQEQVAKALVNKGAALREMKNIEGALAALGEVIVRFHNSTEPGLQEALAMALVNMGTLHHRLGNTAKTVSCYEEVIHEYGDSNEPSLQTQVAKGYSGLGFEKLLQAKQIWYNEPQRLALLDDALKNIEKSMVYIRGKDRIGALGNKAYALFLVGRQDEAKPALLRALKRGGKTLFNDKIFDSQCHPVPEDEAFRALLDELWAQVKPTLPAAMGGTADGPGDAQAGDKGDSQAHHDKG
ncbi:hypothetical protein JCM15519_10900 [Fundidesulfovibrio butyratiphilus]